MSYVLQVLSIIGSYLWMWVCAHARVAYLLAALLTLPAAFIGQGVVPYTGEYIGSIVTVVFQWYTFIAVYAFIQRGGFNPVMRLLCPWGRWEGAWWDTTWTQAARGALRRLTPKERPASAGAAAPGREKTPA